MQKKEIEKFYNKKAKFVYKNNYSKDNLKKLFKEKYDLIPILRKNKTVFDITYWSREFDKEIKPKKLNVNQKHENFHEAEELYQKCWGRVFDTKNDLDQVLNKEGILVMLNEDEVKNVKKN